MVDEANQRERSKAPSWFWGSTAFATVPMGVATVVLATCYGRGLAALVALSLSFFWGVVAAGLLALRFSPRRIRAEMQVRVVENTIQQFLEELNGKDASQWAELIDRLDRLTSKTLENSGRRA